MGAEEAQTCFGDEQQRMGAFLNDDLTTACVCTCSILSSADSGAFWVEKLALVPTALLKSGCQQKIEIHLPPSPEQLSN